MNDALDLLPLVNEKLSSISLQEVSQPTLHLPHFSLLVDPFTNGGVLGLYQFDYPYFQLLGN
jgi:hypothetical protein